MKEKLPVNHEILKWARTSLNMSIKEVAGRIKKDVEQINEWENGTNSPTYPQLEKLAYEIYKRPVALFFFPEVPKVSTPSMDLRTLPDTVIDTLPKGIIYLYRKAKAQQLNLEELYEGNYPVGNSIVEQFSFENNTNISVLAKQVREALGVSIDEQFAWKNVDEAFEKWRTLLEEKGVFIFKDAFRNNDYSGFCIYHKKYPIIYINNSMSSSRQIFTLFHELAHLLLKSGGIDFRSGHVFDSISNEYKRIEKKCNEFAGELLIPGNALSKQEMKIDEMTITNLANKFSVSKEVVLRKYLNFKLIDNQYYQKMVDKWFKDFNEAKVSKKKGSGGDPYYTKKSYLGQKYIRLVFGKYYQSKISIESVADYIGMKVKHIPTFEYKVLS